MHDEKHIEESPTAQELETGDVALNLVGEHAHAFDPATEARVLRKVDRFFLPYLDFNIMTKSTTLPLALNWLTYCKAILGSAILFGMTADLSLSVVVDPNTKPPTVSTNRLSWATSLFYFGMLAGLYPLTIALQRLHTGRLLGGIVIVWSTTCMATAGISTWRGLYVQRFFLGFVESVIPTAATTIISNYYTQREQALRQTAWLWTPSAAIILGGLLNYGFAHIDGGSLRPWQYIYLLAGTLSLVFGLLCFAIPDSPVTAWFLTKEERIVAVERLRRGQTGVTSHKIKWSQVVEAFLDVKLYLLAIMSTASWTTNGAVTGFGPLIVSTFGWNSFQSILLQFPLAAVYGCSLVLGGFISSRVPNVRIVVLIIFSLPVIAGFTMIWKSTWSHHAATPLVGFALIGFYGAAAGQTFALSLSNTAGATKKTVMVSSVWAGFVVGNIVGPQLVKSQSRKQHYPELWLGLIICQCILVVCAGILYAVLRRANRKKDQRCGDEADKDRFAFQDLTDKANPYFRYVL
ncbi:MAG: hypothetical protein Q9227_005585 [Pyrenula ochraceoflavens]